MFEAAFGSLTATLWAHDGGTVRLHGLVVYGYVYSQPMLEWEGQHVLGRLARLETEPWVAEISKFIYFFKDLRKSKNLGWTKSQKYEKSELI